MDMRIIEVPYDGSRWYSSRWTARISIRAGCSGVGRQRGRDAPRVAGTDAVGMDDVIMPTMHTIFDRVSEGSPVPDSVEVTGHGEAAGFHVDRIQALQPHNARTLDDRVQALRPHHDEAVPIAAEEVYQRYITHLTGSAGHIGSGHIDAIPLTPGQDGIGSVCPGE